MALTGTKSPTRRMVLGMALDGALGESSGTALILTSAFGFACSGGLLAALAGGGSGEGLGHGCGGAAEALGASAALLGGAAEALGASAALLDDPEDGGFDADFGTFGT